MSKKRRLSIYVVMGSLWLSGVLWLCLDQFLRPAGPFGRTPHPWQAPLLTLHGIIAILAMYVFGWISARHILRWWRSRSRLFSGTTLAVTLALLAASGFALFFLSDDAWRRGAVVIHEALGLGIALLVLEHWFIGRYQRTPQRAEH